jgi:hypothetical protein
MKPLAEVVMALDQPLNATALGTFAVAHAGGPGALGC